MDIDVSVEGLEAIREATRDIERRYPDDAVVWVVGTGVEYAIYVHEGTRPHTITPTDAEALRFEVNGETVFASEVQHPGTDADPFMRRALRRLDRNSERLTADADSTADAVRRLAFALERFAKEAAPTDTGTLRSSISARRLQ